jgi:NAD(P)-dependent dehydrogenase (short-subunit alcohol dehydrogenase family)
MKKTILITGTSSGIGRATVKLFSERGWNVAATMRTPEKETELQKLKGVKLYALDVQKPDSIDAALNAAIKDFGSIDVIVNNAGYGAVGAFEAASDEQIRRQFDTNVFGVMNVIRGILPYFRGRKAGTIINVTSMGGHLTFPLYSIYHATKWAVEGFSESLHFELRPFNIRIKNITPGPIKTDFYDRSQDLFHKEGLTAYDNYVNATMKNSNEFGKNAPGPEVVAKTIWKAANSSSSRLRYASDFLGKFTLFSRKALPLNWYFAVIRMMTEKGFVRQK